MAIFHGGGSYDTLKCLQNRGT